MGVDVNEVDVDCVDVKEVEVDDVGNVGACQRQDWPM